MDSLACLGVCDVGGSDFDNDAVSGCHEFAGKLVSIVFLFCKDLG